MNLGGEAHPVRWAHDLFARRPRKVGTSLVRPPA
jgi:hypothetical protein